MIEKNRKEKGKYGEELASIYLLENEHKIIARNIHSRFGEIDIISLCKGVVHIVEVKTRFDKYNSINELASYSMSRDKKNRMRKTVYSSQVQACLTNIPYRKMQYDFIAIDVVNTQTYIRLYWNI